MLGVGIDWAEQFHLVALGRGETGVFEVKRVEHTPAAVTALLSRIVGLEPDLAEVRLVIETSHGVLVEQLLDAGFTVVPVNPDLIARRRGPARKKDDAEDARIACLLALDRFTSLRPLIPHGPVAAELRAIARDDERANRDERRLLNRLRADLIATFPAALLIVGDGHGPTHVPADVGTLAHRASVAASDPRRDHRARPGRASWLAGPLRRPGHRPRWPAKHSPPVTILSAPRP